VAGYAGALSARLSGSRRWGEPQPSRSTAIGDTVNFASRLCSLAKPGQVRCSEDCFERVHDSFDGQAQEAVALKGKAGTHVSYVVTRKRQFGG
jgi:class 3 adenylate cyclase